MSIAKFELCNSEVSVHKRQVPDEMIELITIRLNHID